MLKLVAMKILTLDCNQCGAPLEVSEKTRFLTCTFCASRLEVHRTGNAAFTEVLDALQRQTDQVSEDVEVLKIKVEVERLDREWMTERERHIIHGNTGPKVPTKSTAKLVGVPCVIFGLFLGVIGISSLLLPVPGAASRTGTKSAADEVENFAARPGWEGPLYDGDGREYYLGPKSEGILGKPVEYTGRQLGKDVPVEAAPLFHPFRKKHRKRVAMRNKLPILIFAGILFIVFGLGGYAYWSERARTYQRARQRYESQRRKLLEDIAVAEQTAKEKQENE